MLMGILNCVTKHWSELAVESTLCIVHKEDTKLRHTLGILLNSARCKILTR